MKDDHALNLHEKYDSKQKWQKVYSVKMNNLEEFLTMLECYAEKNVPFINYPTYIDLLMLKDITKSLDQTILQLIHLVNIEPKSSKDNNE